MKDLYRNTTRDGMPADETITGFSDKVTKLATKVILGAGGRETVADGKRVLRVPAEAPANVEPLPRPLDRGEEIEKTLRPQIERDLEGGAVDRARAAYLALCLGEADRLKAARPAQWAKGLEALAGHPEVVRQIFEAPGDRGESLRKRAEAAGLRRP